MLKFRNIVFPINLDSKNLTFVKKVFELAVELSGRLHIIYVNDEQAGYRHPADSEEDIALKVKEVVPAELLEKLQVVYAVSRGSVAREIESYCKKEKIDLIIVGHKQRSKFYSFLFDSPDVNIIDSINIPILVIPKQ